MNREKPLSDFNISIKKHLIKFNTIHEGKYSLQKKNREDIEGVPKTYGKHST